MAATPGWAPLFALPYTCGQCGQPFITDTFVLDQKEPVIRCLRGCRTLPPKPRVLRN